MMALVVMKTVKDNESGANEIQENSNDYRDYGIDNPGKMSPIRFNES